MSGNQVNNGREFDPISLEIYWSRLISIIDESAVALLRSSFSNVVRESNDYACALLDGNGDSVADNTLGMPSFVSMMSRTMKQFLEVLPRESWKPGNVAICNDPWIATGHLHDVTTASPIFHRDRLVAFYISAAHMADMGGLGFTADGRSVYEEGLRIPPMWLQREGESNQELLTLLRANVRVPDEVVGDLMARATTGLVCARALQEFLAEQDLDDLLPISGALQERAETSMRRAIEQIPDGTYRHEITMDGYETPILLRVAITVKGSNILVDYDGSSPEQERAMNSVMSYTHAYSAFPIKCVLDPFTPKNEGSYKPIAVVAPEGTVVNPRFPAPVTARGQIGHMLSQVMLGALAQAIPDKVMAECGSAPSFRAVFNGYDAFRKPFSTMITASGGMGARKRLDGLHVTAYPLSTTFGSVEAMESVSPVRYQCKALRPDSGGAGKWKGGYGEHLALTLDTPHPCMLSLVVDRVKNPARGLLGGLTGAPSAVYLNDEQHLHPKARVKITPGDVVHLLYPAGGGYGDPRERDRALVLKDLENGIVTRGAAKERYGVVPAEGEIGEEPEE